MFDGKILKDGSVTLAKLATALANSLLRSDTAVAWTVAQNAGSQELTNLGAPSAGTSAARLQDVQNIPWKQAVRAATTGNITLTGAQTIDGVSDLAVGVDRVLVRAQTNPAQNGPYIVQSGAWTRTSDGDSATELKGAVFHVLEGSTNAGKRFAANIAAGAFTINTSPIPFLDIGPGTAAAFPTTANKNMVGAVTTTDFQVACATGITYKPAQGSYVRVHFNGVALRLGDGVKTAECYFSADGGVTAKTIANIAANDLLYLVGSVLGCQSAATDWWEFDYCV